MHRLSHAGNRRQSRTYEQLEVRNMLASASASLVLASDIRASVEVDPNREGAVNVTLHHSNFVNDGLRFEIRRTAEGVGFRKHHATGFSIDLDSSKPGVQAYSDISRLTIIGGPNDDIIVLDENSGKLAREFEIDGLSGNDRLEYWRDSDGLQRANVIDVNISTGRIEFVSDNDQSARQVRAAHTSRLEDFAFYGGNSEGTLVVQTGSGHADRLEWQPGRVDVQLGPTPDTAPKTRISYSMFDDVWLLTAGGADTVTLRDNGYRSGTPEAEGQSLLYHRLHVGTQDENDLIQWNLTGSRSIVDISIDGGAGSQNRLEMRSYRGQGEEFHVDGDSIDYFDAFHIEARQYPHFEIPDHVIPIPIGNQVLPGHPEAVIVPKQFAYDDIQQLYLATGGGDDTIVVDERVAGPLPREVTIDAQDDNDAIELNVVAKYPASRYYIDGGTGTNGLSQFIRKEALSETGPVLSHFDPIEAAVNLRGNELSVNYYNPGIGARAGLIPSQEENDVVTTYSHLAGLTVISEIGGSVRVAEQDQAKLPDSVRLLLRRAMEVILPVRLDQASTRWSVDGNGSAPSQLTISTGDHADRVEILPHELNMRSIVGGAESAATRIAYQGVNLTIGTEGGDDSVTICHSATLPPLLLYTGHGNDRIELNLTQAGAALDNLRRIDGGEGIHDLLVVRDAPGNNLNLTIHNNSLSSTPLHAPGIEILELYGYDGDDRLVNDTAARAFFDGGAGNDTLIGGSGVDRIFGGDGIEQLFGNAGDDFLFADYDSLLNLFPLSGELLDGGPGNDVLVTRAVDQVITGGGNDTVKDHPIDIPPNPQAIPPVGNDQSGGGGGSIVTLQGTGVTPLVAATGGAIGGNGGFSLVGTSGTIPSHGQD